MELTGNTIRAYTVYYLSINGSLGRFGQVVVEIDTRSELLRWETVHSIIPHTVFAQVTVHSPKTLQRYTQVAV
jgi:hypothetical protein